MNVWTMAGLYFRRRAAFALPASRLEPNLPAHGSVGAAAYLALPLGILGLSIQAMPGGAESLPVFAAIRSRPWPGFGDSFVIRRLTEEAGRRCDRKGAICSNLAQGLTGFVLGVV